MTKVIVFGATGAIGTSLVKILCAEHKGWEIFAVTRSVKGTSRLASMNLPPNVTMVEGDPFDEESVLELTADCDIVYSCIGFHRDERKYWAKHWPRIVLENLLAAIKSDSINGSMQKKRLVFSDNLYAYGPGENISPKASTVAPSNKSKPVIRAKVREMMVQHMAQYPGTLTAVGGADFCGPHVTDKGFLGDTVAGKITQGESTLTTGSVSVVDDFCYAPDFARALAVVSANDENFLMAADKFWICPHTSHHKTLQEIANDIAVKVAVADNTTTLTGSCLFSKGPGAASADAARRTMLEEPKAAEAPDSGNCGFWGPILDVIFGRGGIPEKKVDNAAVRNDFDPATR
jgi:nucleoside-diphosphate-sugar epimerase